MIPLKLVTLIYKLADKLATHSTSLSEVNRSGKAVRVAEKMVRAKSEKLLGGSYCGMGKRPTETSTLTGSS
jgi:hypothetical protein